MISKLNNKRYKNKPKLKDRVIRCDSHDGKYSEPNRKASLYLKKIAKLNLSELDQVEYTILLAITQYDQTHLTSMFRLLRRYNAIKFNEIL